jgi:hemerythrin
MFEMNSIAVPSEHYSFFTIMKELRKINLVAMNKVSFEEHKETLRGIIKYLGLQFKE